MPRSVEHVNGVDLCVEDFGDPDSPPVLLVSGAESSMDWWDSEFCELIAAAGRRVIRYDLRDVGASTSYPPGEPGYSGDDLIDDAVALIARLGLAPVHAVGVSMGAGIAAQVAIRRPELPRRSCGRSPAPACSRSEAWGTSARRGRPGSRSSPSSSRTRPRDPHTA